MDWESTWNTWHFYAIEKPRNRARRWWAQHGTPVVRRWARWRLAWERRREVYHLWYVGRVKYGPRRGIQAQIAAQLKMSRATICRDFAALDLRAWGREA